VQISSFIAKLKACRRELVVNKFAGQVWGLALRLPRHPDANEHGFLSLMSMPSASYFGGVIPPETIMDEHGQIEVRGWKVILRLLVTQGHLSRNKVNSWFGSSWEAKA
jgi:hypothetical protein